MSLNPGRSLAVLTLAGLMVAGSACSQEEATLPDEEGPAVQATYTEPYRPQFHFTPAVNWTNDPNGLVYYQGEYHLFYQHNPFGDQWGHMSWGHAVSDDMLHWKHLPVAIPEEEGIMIFSGSVVVDHQNTSGLCENPDAGDPSCLVALYTGHTDTLQNQHIAYSNDRGRTWTKYAGNPVLDIGKKDFRDPKVFWYAPESKWIMVLALSLDYKVHFYSSKNLIDWTFMSEFGPAGATSGIWECPDLFELPVEGLPGQTRWVLDVDINPGSVAGGSGGQYYIGRFDGTTFTNENPADQTLWVDYGKDFYATISFSDVPDDRRIWLAWMSNWEYSSEIPTSPWRGAMTLPRRLGLRQYPEGIRLTQHPVEELERLRGGHVHLAGEDLAEGGTLLADQGVTGKALELIAEFDPGTASEVGLRVRVGPNEETVIGYDVAAREVFVDRSRSGAEVHAAFPGRQAGPLPRGEGPVRLHVFVDWSSVEVFAGDGRTMITDRIFPSPESEGLEVYAKGGTARLVSLDVWQLSSVWQDESTASSAP